MKFRLFAWEKNGSRWNQVHQLAMGLRVWHGGDVSSLAFAVKPRREAIPAFKTYGCVDNTKLDKIMERFGIWHLLRELQQIQLFLRLLDKQQMSK